ncbi:MAG: CHASE3 domain-containing protein [Dehalococcoidia bacterium]|nr:CHASE3 domain-containing protein [Dehalococcoidia bacterium]
MPAFAHHGSDRGVATLRTPSRRRLLLGGALALAIAVGCTVAALAVVSNRDYRDANDEVERSHHLNASLDAVLITMLDAETAMRGFALTGDDSFLQPFTDARPELDARFAEIEALRPGATQEERLIELRQLADERLALAGEVIALRHTAGANAAAAAIAGGLGKSVMDSLRTLVSTMSADATATLERRTNNASTEADVALATMIALAAIDLALLSTIVLVGVRELRRRNRATRRALDTARARYEAIGEAIPLGVWAAGPNGEMQYLSEAFLDRTGLESQAALGFGWAQAIDEEVREATLRDWQGTIAARAPWTYELRLRGQDGRLCTALSRGVPVLSAQGELIGYAGINLDISDRKEMEEALRRANSAKDEFLGLVSHELRSPLTAILGNAALIGRGAAATGVDPGESAAEIVRHAQRLQRLIENMLILAREEAGAHWDLEPLLVQHAVRPVVEQHRTNFPASPVELDLAANLPPVLAEPTFFEQVLANLLSNAAKYSPPGKPIEITARSEDDAVVVTVRDRGQGISPEEVETVLRPFVRSQRTAGMASGLGLGLAVCRRLAEAMGGSLFLQPRPGGGTEAGFTLPVASLPGEDATSPLEAAPELLEAG